MKVLIINRREDLWKGGDWTQLRHTVKALKKLGVDVDVMESRGYGWSFFAKRYDIIHTFNFNMVWNEWLKEDKYPDTKYVCSMIYQPEQETFDKKTLQQMYDNLDAAIFLHDGEPERLLTDGIKVNKKKHHFIPNGIEPYWFDEPTNPFKTASITGIPPYVLTVGRMSSHKGQESVLRACAQLGAPYISIGGASRVDKGLLQVIPDKPRKELKRYYKNCACFVLASRDELMPMTVMEAGAQAKNIVLTSNCKWKLPHVEYVDYGDVNGIMKAIERSVKKPPNLPLQSMLKKMTWENTAKQILKVYKKILKEK